jgi:hypothetical protein
MNGRENIKKEREIQFEKAIQLQFQWKCIAELFYNLSSFLLPTAPPFMLQFEVNIHYFSIVHTLCIYVHFNCSVPTFTLL